MISELEVLRALPSKNAKFGLIIQYEWRHYPSAQDIITQIAFEELLEERR